MKCSRRSARPAPDALRVDSRQLDVQFSPIKQLDLLRGEARMPRVSCSSYRACLAIAILLFAPALGLHAIGAPSVSNPKPGEPTDPKARKTFASAVEFQKQGQKGAALGEFRKANTQDGGHCTACLSRAYSLAMETGAYKEAESVLRDFQTGKDRCHKGNSSFPVGSCPATGGPKHKEGQLLYGKLRRVQNRAPVGFIACPGALRPGRFPRPTSSGRSGPRGVQGISRR